MRRGSRRFDYRQRSRGPAAVSAAAWDERLSLKLSFCSDGVVVTRAGGSASFYKPFHSLSSSSIELPRQSASSWQEALPSLPLLLLRFLYFYASFNASYPFVSKVHQYFGWDDCVHIVLVCVHVYTVFDNVGICEFFSSKVFFFYSNYFHE